MSESKLSILYTEDTQPLYQHTVPYMEVLLDAEVTHTTNNGEAEQMLFEEGKRFDVYVFDDSAGTGGGHGIKIAVELAKKLKEEGRGGIVISACSSNATILTSKEGPVTFNDLIENQVEFWYKHTEVYKMVPWIASCIKEGKQISRVEWLESMEENTGYETWGSGNETERMLRFYAMGGCDESHRGSLFTLDMPQLIGKLREGSMFNDALVEMSQEGGIKGERQG